MPKTKTKTTAKPTPELTYVLFGLDESGHPRAAKFPAHDERLIGRIALSMGLRVGIATKKYADTLTRLAAGRAHGTGQNVVPTIQREMYDHLNGLVGGEPSPKPISIPALKDAIRPGHLVVAWSSIATGWWEAVVVKVEDDVFTLKWRDYPAEAVVRTRREIALLQPE